MSARAYEATPVGRRILRPATTPAAADSRIAQIEQRRKSAMVALLNEFERDIEPLIAPGNREAIDHFKKSCRGKVNGLAFQAKELLALEPGERFNEAAADLAEQFAFDGNGGTTKP